MILSPERITFDRITEHIWLGSRISSLDDYHRLRASGVKACVDMKEEGADPWTFESFLWLPTIDHHPPTRAHLHLGMAFLRQCEKNALPAFVHCMAGVGRSATMVLAHLLGRDFKEQGTDAALDFLCGKRSCVNPSDRQIASAEDAARTFEP